MSIIYRARSKTSNKVYIGFTKQKLSVRQYHHKYEAIKRNRSLPFHNAIRKYGWEDFEWEILFESWDDDYCLCIVEPQLIKDHDAIKNGYNICEGGRKGPTLKGPLNGMYGKTHSDKNKEKQSIRVTKLFKGKTYEEILGENKAKELKALRSQKFSEVRSNMKYLDTKQYIFTHKEGYIFCGTRAEFCEKYNIPFKRITELINGKRKTFLGWQTMF